VILIVAVRFLDTLYIMLHGQLQNAELRKTLCILVKLEITDSTAGTTLYIDHLV